MKPRYPVIAAAILLCLLFAVMFTAGFQSSSVEAQIKAAFLFNFAQFIQWPEAAFTDRNTPFTMCTVGDSFDSALEKTVEAEMLNGRRVTVRRLNAMEPVKGCHLLYVGRIQTQRAIEIITSAEGMPVLTVGDSEDFINAGGMIRFTESGRRIRFEINPDAAERVSLKVSSRLLRLADIARPRERAATR